MLQQMTNEIFHLTSMKGFPVIVYKTKILVFVILEKGNLQKVLLLSFFICLLELFVENA